MKKLLVFVNNIWKQFWKVIFGTLKEIINNIEAVLILSMASIGLTNLLAEVPFHIALPLFVEIPMVVPIISILTIIMLVSILNWRTKCIA
jgi:hypothetical protein